MTRSVRLARQAATPSSPPPAVSLIALPAEEGCQHFGYIGIVFDDQQAC
jgi:hypothetical protein